MPEDESKLIDETRRLLDARAGNLETKITARLQAARKQAVESTRERGHGHRGWLPVGGFAVASLVIAVTATLWLSDPVAPTQNIEDMDILAANESPEFYQDLDFYLWLEERARAG